MARDFDGDIDLVILDVAAGLERRLPSPGVAEYGGRFAPDDALIASHLEADGEARIAILASDGSDRRTITAGGQHYSPRAGPMKRRSRPANAATAPRSRTSGCGSR